MKIETNRLLIRSFTRDDIPAYHRVVSDPKVTRFLRNPLPHELEEAERYILNTIDEEKRTGIGRYAVETIENGDFIGFCGFAKIDEIIDFGWRYKSNSWGQGFGTEAALAVLDFGLSKLKLTNLVAHAAIENVASLKIIEKLGFDGPYYSDHQGRKIAKYFQK